MTPGLGSRFTVERRPDGLTIDGHWHFLSAKRQARDLTNMSRACHWVRDQKDGGRVVYVAEADQRSRKGRR